jgi:hypothetical protein
MTLSPDFSFHLRFKEVALVSHFCALSSGLSPALRYSVDEFAELDEIFFP